MTARRLRQIHDLCSTLSDIVSDFCHDMPAEHIRPYHNLEKIGVHNTRRLDLYFKIQETFGLRLDYSIFDIKTMDDLVYAIQAAPELPPIVEGPDETPVEPQVTVPPPSPDTIVRPFHERMREQQNAQVRQEMFVRALRSAEPVLERGAQSKWPRSMRRHSGSALRDVRAVLRIAGSEPITEEAILEEIGFLVGILQANRLAAGGAA